MNKISLLVFSGCMATTFAWGGDFVAPGDGTVLDRSAKLLWQQAENPRMVWQAAADRCQELNLAGRSDWRLPTKEELSTLVDPKRTDPAVDIRFFPKTKSTAYWTGTQEKDRIWGIGFSDGEEFIFGGTELALYVRCVAEAKGTPPSVAASAPAKPISPAPEKPATPAAPTPPASPPPAVTAAAEKSTPDDSEATETVRRWANAWTKQDVAAYLSFYGEKFIPPAGASRSAWEAQRQRALTKPSWVKVDIADLKASPVAEGHVRIEFLQTYRSNIFQDRVRKALVLVREGGQWSILSEEKLP